MTVAWEHFLLQLLLGFAALAAVGGGGFLLLCLGDLPDRKRADPPPRFDNPRWYERFVAWNYERRLERLIRRTKRRVR